MVLRADGRARHELRKMTITEKFLKFPEGSVLIEMGNTRVICTATVEEKVPSFLKNTGTGWLTAEYGMIPAATQTRNLRESSAGRVGGRTQEIQRIIGRSLRAVTDLSFFGERTVYIDCDVIQADGGTRTASITGAFIALVDLFRALLMRGVIDRLPIKDYISAVSAGIVDGEVLLDLDYEEDSRAEVDMNFVGTAGGLFVEIQGTAEQRPFARNRLTMMTDLALQGISDLTARQREILGDLD
jgi:ribonuclease PH